MSKYVLLDLKNFFLASDGARSVEEQQKVQEVRDYLKLKIDWDCEVHTLFREENLGCKNAVSSAIGWFFDQVDRGIILEDDTLPSTDFFRFCDELLEYYQDNERVFHIGGYRYQNLSSIPYDYDFSQFIHIWGWASWKRAWSFYQADISQLKEKQELIIRVTGRNRF